MPDGGAVGLAVAVAVGAGVAVFGALNSTSFANRKSCSATPATNTRSPRATWLGAANTGCLAGAAIDVPVCCATGVVDGATVAVDGVMVIVSVSLVPATLTVKVTGLGLAFIAATLAVPARRGEVLHRRHLGQGSERPLLVGGPHGERRAEGDLLADRVAEVQRVASGLRRCGGGVAAGGDRRHAYRAAAHEYRGGDAQSYLRTGLAVAALAAAHMRCLLLRTAAPATRNPRTSLRAAVSDGPSVNDFEIAAPGGG